MKFARHTLAIDEKRVDFKPAIWRPRTGVNLKQVWFCGVHVDIGGSYPPDKDGKSAADTALGWMMDEALAADLLLEPHLKAALSDGTGARLHEHRRKLFLFQGRLQRHIEHKGIDMHIHPSVKARYEREPSYRPPEIEKLVNLRGWPQLNVST